MCIRSEKTRSWMSNIVSIDIRWLMALHFEKYIKNFCNDFCNLCIYATSKIKVC